MQLPTFSVRQALRFYLFSLFLLLTPILLNRCYFNGTLVGYSNFLTYEGIFLLFIGLCLIVNFIFTFSENFNQIKSIFIASLFSILVFGLDLKQPIFAITLNLCLVPLFFIAPKDVYFKKIKLTNTLKLVVLFFMTMHLGLILSPNFTKHNHNMALVSGFVLIILVAYWKAWLTIPLLIAFTLLLFFTNKIIAETLSYFHMFPILGHPPKTDIQHYTYYYLSPFAAHVLVPISLLIFFQSKLTITSVVKANILDNDFINN